MLFNSVEYIVFFLPAVVSVYFLLGRFAPRQAAALWLLGASLFFYAWWDVAYLPLIVGSVLFNFAIGSQLERRPRLLALGVAIDLGLLGYFKYWNFFLDNAGAALGRSFDVGTIVLPLAISFFTFQQIAYLVDRRRGLVSEHSFLRYAVFVTFFPQLIAGPIVHHSEMMPQFADPQNARLRWDNAARGIYVFMIGLAKKVFVADYFASVATPGFDSSAELSFLEAWCVSLAYTMQIYFDFSGYTDMAIGAARIFNIALPLNFDSPYKATNIRDFWQRWHMTLSRFLRDYLYISLGGNRSGRLLTYRNLLLTFVLGGLWHGAGWTFVVWGGLHGLAVAGHRWWSERGYRMNPYLGWFLTFQFANFAWVFFRATSFGDALRVLRGMAGLNGVTLPREIADSVGSAFALSDWVFIDATGKLLPFLVVALGVAFFARNSNELGERFRPSALTWAWTVVLFAVAMLNINAYSEFLYFNF